LILAAPSSPVLAICASETVPVAFAAVYDRRRRRNCLCIHIGRGQDYGRKMTCPWAKHEDDDWAWAFLHDRKLEGGAMKWFTLTDNNTQECLAPEVLREMTAETV
jgi:hypothetical protein